MFFVMGIGFVASLGNSAPERALGPPRKAAVRTGLVFGFSDWPRDPLGPMDLGRLVGIDPQLNGALVTVLLYTGYLILRAAMGDDERVGHRCRLQRVCLRDARHPADGAPAVHRKPAPRQGWKPEQLRPRQQPRAVFYPAVIGWGALCYWMYTLRLRMNRLEHRLLTMNAMSTLF